MKVKDKNGTAETTETVTVRKMPKKLAKVLSFVIQCSFMYTYCFAIGMYFLPMSAVVLGSYAGVTYESSVLDIMVFIGFPFLFYTILLAVFSVWFLKGFRNLIKRWIDRISA